jgi:hypothetical protein
VYIYLCVRSPRAKVPDLQHKTNRAVLGDPDSEPKRNPNARSLPPPLIQRTASSFLTLHIVGDAPTLFASVWVILVHSGRGYAR